MGIFGESKQSIIERYEKLLKEKESENGILIDKISNLENCISQKDFKIKELESVIAKEKECDLYLQKKKEKEDYYKKEIDKFDKMVKKDDILIEGVGNASLLEAGIYKSGIDFPTGKYDFYVLEGEGQLSCTKGDIFENMSDEPHDSYIRKYRNLSAPKGCKIEVTRNLKLIMYYSKPVKPKQNETKEENIVSSGQYKIGTDIPSGNYIFEIKSGQGYIDDDDDVYIKFGDECTNNSIKRARVTLKRGKILTVDGNLELYLYNANRINIEKSEFKLNESKNIICGGVYEAGIDIPYGYYNIFLSSGSGTFELETLNEERLDFYEDFSADETTKYYNLLVEIGDIITIENGLEVYMELSKAYMNKNISKSILREIEDVQEELKILSNEAIRKYYIFSYYDSITSEECINKLLILKQNEKELREKNRDVLIKSDNDVCGKKNERLIRKILRTFNSECDNVILDVGTKNIDQSRKNIYKSFESLNKLYSCDNIELSKDILELKLEQVTLMYTYELKRQQEKEIQKAIKEQMIEEAKAEKEIQEQKKKIEKDLQQHLGEINRLMKYMQKTQADVERQMYMDKIKELEEKIKELEEDKETVLEREANAKAGFVYIISNIGSFGEDIYKIGMTRRLEPMDRIKELGSASVPFEFDVHAMIFSSDAPDLENMLHKRFADKAVNKVNPRKEFFRVDIDEIERVVKDNYNDTVQFTKIPVAAEYRKSMEL